MGITNFRIRGKKYNFMKLITCSISNKKVIALLLVAGQQGCHGFCVGSTHSLSKPLLREQHCNYNLVRQHEMSSSSSNTVGIMDEKFQSYTHLIAIPMGECREMSVALESVQRAVTYKCPSLENACIAPTMARLPLLYVDATNISNEILHQLVRGAVNNIIEDHNDSTAKPFMMKFKGLEIDGQMNEVLYCVGKTDDEGATTTRLQNIVYTLRTTIEALGYRTMLPPDAPQVKSSFNTHFIDSNGTNNNNQQQWRPRIPFMRLPPMENIHLDDDGDEEWRTPEEGGNGISPILWYKWWNDEFTEEEGDGVRLCEVAIYCRSNTSSSSLNPSCLSENSFPRPLLQFKTPLPGGYNNDSINDDNTMSSTQFKEAQQQQTIMAASSSSSNSFLDIDYTTAIEYNVDIEDELDISTATSVVQATSIKETWPSKDPLLVQDDSTPRITRVDTSAADMEEALYNNNVVYSDEDDTRSVESKVKKPWPKEPLINKYNRGLKAARIKEVSAQQQQQQDPLPPYPSNEYFSGPWRVVSFPMDSNYANPDSLVVFQNSQSCDNIILRVDGAIAGGPILDSKTKQKAAGGTWKMFQAEYVGPPQEKEEQTKSSNKIIKTRMRIVLLIPPLKTEELVMEGEVTRITMPTSLLSRPTTEASEEECYDDTGEPENDSLLHCGGEAWIREIATGRRAKLGLFSIVKLRTMDPSELHISVPPPRRGLQ